jgi:hypothetical protein
MTRLQAHGNTAAIESIPIFYSEKMVASVTSFSPSAGKPRDVVKSWQRLGIPLKVIAPVPLTAEQFYMAHDRSYVDDILACRISNGFGNHSPEVAASLPYQSPLRKVLNLHDHTMEMCAEAILPKKTLGVH